jgi:hypothetical protein
MVGFLLVADSGGVEHLDIDICLTIMCLRSESSDLSDPLLYLCFHISVEPPDGSLHKGSVGENIVSVSSLDVANREDEVLEG